ncbi:hypothetical protein L1887_36601 [Cichorium endivia]|nr:hypothetical protein L1887_36601 [Cichorium endivia]
MNSPSIFTSSIVQLVGKKEKERATKLLLVQYEGRTTAGMVTHGAGGGLRRCWWLGNKEKANAVPLGLVVLMHSVQILLFHILGCFLSHHISLLLDLRVSIQILWFFKYCKDQGYSGLHAAYPIRKKQVYFFLFKGYLCVDWDVGFV